MRMLSKAVMLRPDDVGYMKNLATLALELGETEDAIGLYKRSWPFTPGTSRRSSLSGIYASSADNPRMRSFSSSGYLKRSQAMSRLPTRLKDRAGEGKRA